MPESGEALIRFQLTGEATRAQLDEVARCLGEQGVQFLVAIEGEVISPSILIDHAHGPQGLPVPIVTDMTIAEFLVTEGYDETVARTQVATALWKLRHHFHEHAPDCPCQLRYVQLQGRDGYSWVSHWGLDPLSLVAFAELPHKETVGLIEGFGPARLALLRKVGQRIKADLDQA